jgi:hypothetical protein
MRQSTIASFPARFSRQVFLENLLREWWSISRFRTAKNVTAISACSISASKRDQISLHNQSEFFREAVGLIPRLSLLSDSPAEITFLANRARFKTVDV